MADYNEFQTTSPEEIEAERTRKFVKDNGYKSIFGRFTQFWTCPKCAATTYDPQSHSKWHYELEDWIEDAIDHKVNKYSPY